MAPRSTAELRGLSADAMTLNVRECARFDDEDAKIGLWLYCDNERTLAYDGERDGRLYVEFRHETLGWAVRVGTTGWKVWANPKLAGRAVLVGSVTRQSSSRWNIIRTAHSPAPPNGCGSILVSLLRQWDAMALRLAHRSSSNPALAGEDLVGCPPRVSSCGSGGRHVDGEVP